MSAGLLETWYGGGGVRNEAPRKFVARKELYCPDCVGFRLHSTTSVEKGVEVKCLDCGSSDIYVQQGQLGGLPESLSMEAMLVLLFGAETLSRVIREGEQPDG